MALYINIGLIYLIISFSVALISYVALKKQILGKFWGALVIALIGSSLGGVIGYFFKDVIRYLANFNNVNIFPPIITSFLVVWLFAKVSE